MFMFGALKKLGVNEEESPKLCGHCVINGELSRQRQLLSTQRIISKYYSKKPFFYKHLLVIFSNKDREKVNIDIT